MEPVRKRSHHRLQHIPVALVRATFRLRFKFPIKFKNRSVGQTLTVTMSSQHAPQDRQNPRLPINQGAVAVKADSSELREIHSREQASQLDNTILTRAADRARVMADASARVAA